MQRRNPLAEALLRNDGVFLRAGHQPRVNYVFRRQTIGHCRIEIAFVPNEPITAAEITLQRLVLGNSYTIPPKIGMREPTD